MATRCSVCERDIVPQLKNHPEEKTVTWEVCPFCQRQLDALEKYTLEKHDICHLCSLPEKCVICGECPAETNNAYFRRHWLETA